MARKLSELRNQSDARLLSFEGVISRLDKLPTVIGLSEHLSVSSAAARRLIGEKEILESRLQAAHLQVRAGRDEIAKLREAMKARVTISGSEHAIWCRAISAGEPCDCGAKDPSPNQRARCDASNWNGDPCSLDAGHEGTHKL